MAEPKTVKAGDRSISVPTGLFIGNEWVEAVGKTTFGIENPATGEEIIQIQEGRAEDVDIAVKKARALFNDPAYKEMNPMDRGAILLKLADLMEEAKDDLIALEMLDTGKTYKVSLLWDRTGSNMARTVSCHIHFETDESSKPRLWISLPLLAPFGIMLDGLTRCWA